jgi:hypothetical protein
MPINIAVIKLPKIQNPPRNCRYRKDDMKFHSEDPQILGAKTKIVNWVFWHLGFVNSWINVAQVSEKKQLTLSNPIFLPPTYSPALIYFGRESGWWITCNFNTVLKEKNRNRKSTTCAICWLKSVLHEEKCRELRHYDFPVPRLFLM